jgi:transposase InsO family protein
MNTAEIATDATAFMDGSAWVAAVGPIDVHRHRDRRLVALDVVADWAGARVGLHFIPPGQPWRNGYIESFNSRVRDECLNINMFWSLAQARVVISDWKADYNHRRRHSALGYQAPAVYAAARTHP